MVTTVAGLFGAPSQAAGNDAASSAMVDKINEVRARYGLRALRSSSSLNGSSERFAEHLMRTDVLAHRSSPSTGGGYRRSGEVLAMHTGTRNRISSTVRQWMHSPSHRAVLLSRSMRELGAGVAHGRFGGSRAVVWVAQVGRR
jgi:uncharacterized protein YkwD